MTDEALAIAHEAKNMATKALTMVDSMQPQLVMIGNSLNEMRRENTEQHRENGRTLKDSLEVVHERISTVKTTIDTNRAITAGEIKAVDDKLSARVTAHVTIWSKYRDKAFWVMVAVVLALLFDRMGIKLPDLGL